MPERIDEYEILTAQLTETVESFAQEVSHKIESGWQPYGPPFIVLDTQWAQINQAMVKYNKGWGAPKKLDDIKR